MQEKLLWMYCIHRHETSGTHPVAVDDINFSNRQLKVTSKGEQTTPDSNGDERWIR